MTGIPVPGLDSEHQQLLDLLGPGIINNLKDPNDRHLVLLRDAVRRLGPLLPLLQPDREPKNIDEALKLLDMLNGSFEFCQCNELIISPYRSVLLHCFDCHQ